ncbi:MAG: hypothetical protein Q9161_002526 [Pseudevernia consocians]
MASDQDEHRDKRLKLAEDIGGESTSSTTPSASRLNARPEPSSTPYNTLSASSHFNNTHPLALPNPISRPQANDDLYQDATDNSASKGEEIALLSRDRRIVSQTIDESAQMENIASSPVDDEHNKDHPGESDHHKGENDIYDYSTSKGKERVLDPPTDSRTNVLHGAVDTNNGETPDENMENHDDDENVNQEDLDHEEDSGEGDSDDEKMNQEDRDHEEDSGEGDSDDEKMNQEDLDPEEDSGEGDSDDNQGTVEPGSLGGQRAFLRIPHAEPVDYPVQELRLREDGTWDVRPEGRK